MELYNAGDHINALKMFIILSEKDKDNIEQSQTFQKYIKKIYYNREIIYPTEFLDWLKKEVDIGNSFAQLTLGIFNEESLGGFKKNMREAFRLYKLSYEQQNRLSGVK